MSGSSDDSSFAKLYARVRSIPLQDAVAFVVVAFAFVHAIRILRVGWSQPILDMHTFRQTQTAISAYWMAHGGPLLRYETPVFGAPYCAPFEFPLYQWLVVGVHWMGRISLDESGRFVSAAFFLACLPPVYRFQRSLGSPRSASFLGVAILLFSPIYLYWSRTFLIESTALFFSLATLAYGHDVVARRASRGAHVAIAIAATLASLVKVTTAFGYLLALAILVLLAFVEDADRRTNLRRYAVAVVSFLVIPLLAVVLWTRFTDAVKSENLLAADTMTSDALRPWIYGTRELKLDPRTWTGLFDRTMLEAFGGVAFFSVCAAFAFFRSKRVDAVIALTVGIVATFAIFTNLHVAHDYYQYATCAFVILIAALGIAATDLHGVRWVLVLVLVGFGAYQARTFHRATYFVDQRERYWTDALLTTEAVKRHTAPSELVVFYGQDWSPVMPYYAERRALMNNWNYAPSDSRIQRTLERSRRAGNPLGAVVLCGTLRVSRRNDAVVLLGHPLTCEATRLCDVCY